MDIYNEKRLIASQIILELYKAKNEEQLKILAAQIKVSLEKL